MVRTILWATLVAGTLDILSAFVFGAIGGAAPGRILRYVASGPFGDAMRDGGAGAAVLGLAVHFALMTIMVAVYAVAAPRLGWPLRHPVPAGLAYGALIYLVMYWLVLPTRFPGATPKLDPWSLGNALFSHLICVGLPIALIVAWRMAREPALRAA